MHLQANKLKVYLYSSLSLSGISAILYILCFVMSFDRTVNYFSASPLIYITRTLLAISIAWTASLLILIPRDGLISTAPAYRSFSAKFAYVLTAAFIFSTFLHIRLITASITSLLGSVAGALVAAYTGMTAIYPDSKKAVRSLLGYAPIVWAFLSIIDAYFNTYVTMNSPMKLLLVFSMIFLMLFQIQEEGYSVDHGRPRMYAVFGLLSVMMSLAFSLSYFICTLTGIYKIPEFMPTAIGSLAYAVYTVGRLFDMLSVSEMNIVAENDTDTTENQDE